MGRKLEKKRGLRAGRRADRLRDVAEAAQPETMQGTAGPQRPRPVAPDAALLPCDVWTKNHVPNSVSMTYRSERTGTVAYQFNAAGFRGEDLNPQADFRVCVVGESHAIGLGVPYELCFAHRFKVHFAAATGIPPDSVNVVNLACTAASSDYCLRSLARQIDIVRPHLVLATWPVTDRTELYEEDRIRTCSISAVELKEVDQIPFALQGFIDFYTPEWGKMNSARNALLFQMLSERHGAEHIIMARGLRRKVYDTPLLQTFFRELDLDRILPNRMFVVRPDLSADGQHCGPRSHEAVALLLLTRYADLAKLRGEPQRGQQIAAYVQQAKAESPDWAYVQEKLATEKGEEPD